MGTVIRLSLTDWAAATKALRDAERTAAVVFVEAADVRFGDGAERFLQRLVSTRLPTVSVVSGQSDATALAILAGVSVGFVSNDVSVSVDTPTVLALGLTSSLPIAVGAAPARGLLFSERLDAAALRSCGLARHGEDPDAVATRLTDPAAALLVRSLRVAARSTAEQARAYDAELRQLG
jgi:hypothetical protein